MVKTKLFLLALLFVVIPKGIYAYTKDQIVKINHMNYKGVSPKTQLQAYTLKRIIS